MKSFILNIIAIIFITLMELVSANCFPSGNTANMGNSNGSSEIISVTNEHGTEQVIIKDDNSDKTETENVGNSEVSTVPQTEQQDIETTAGTQKMEGEENELPIIVN